jgi:hypothetical protein
MMASSIRKYTRDDLLRLRESPLVQKPEHLPAIEQWIEYVYADRESREKLRIPHSEAAPSQQSQTQSTSGHARRLQHTKSAGGATGAGAGAAGESSPMGNFSAGNRPSLVSTRTATSRNGGQYNSFLILFSPVTFPRLTFGYS